MEGFGNAKTTPATEQKPSVRFNDVSVTEGKICSSEARSEDFKPSGILQVSKTDQERTR